MKKYLSIALLTGALMFSGCGNSDEFVFTNTNVVVAPVCVDDAYTTNQDTTLTVNAANGVLSNDTPNGGVVVAFDATSTANGTVNVNQTGAFTYTPANSFTGTDTFTYTVANSAGQRTCTVTITVVAINGFFVDAVNGNDGTGSFNGGLPFQTIQAAVAAAPTNADIVVLPGSYTGTVNLKDGQRLLGSGSTLVNPQAVNRPQLTGPVVMADGNTVDFVRIDGTNGSAIDVSNQNGGTVTNCEFANTTNTGGGVAGVGVRGNWTVSNNAFQDLAGTAVFMTATNTDSLVVIVRNSTMTGSDLGAVGFISEDTSDIKASVTENIFRNNNQSLGDAFEVECRANSTFCLDLENNINDLDSNPNNSDDGVYSLFDSSAGTSTLTVEQFAGGNLTNPQPGGAGNTGIVDDNTGIGGDLPTSESDGFCGF